MGVEEASPLLADAGDAPITWGTARRRRVTAGVAVVAAVGALAVLSSSSRASGRDVAARLSSSSSATETVTVKLVVRSAYERASGRAIGDGKYPFNVVEAHRPSTLTLASGALALWHVPSLNYTSAAPEATTPELTFFPAGARHAVRATLAVVGSGADADELVVGETLEFDLASKLVRRELRTLSDADRERFFAALHHVYTVEQADGVALWGSDYKSAAWLVREHLYGAADKSCDHWHDDAGILNHHVGITWQLEQSLNAIDPGVAAHYWDYTVDAATAGGDDADDAFQWWSTSDIFDDDWFGAVVTNNSQHVVTTGRWAYTPVLRDAEGAFSNVTNAYGLLRSPWNTNPTPFLLRSRFTLGAESDGFATFPTCTQFARTLATSEWLGTMLNQLNGGLHGPVHIMVGGHWSFDAAEWGNVTKRLTHPDAFLLLSKFLWRQGYVRCPAYCATDTPADECTCACPALSATDGSGTTAAELPEAAGVWSLSSNADLATLMAENGLSDADLAATLCHVGHPGEMFTSAAPQDPLFWPLHGMAERFLQYARMLKAEGTLDFDETWGYEHMTLLPSDTGVVCDWSAVDSAASGRGSAGTDVYAMPACAKATCPGHKADDTLPFEGLRADQAGLYTNAEFYELTSPYSDAMPYTYDSLTYWPGCDNQSLEDAMATATTPPPPPGGYRALAPRRAPRE